MRLNLDMNCSLLESLNSINVILNSCEYNYLSNISLFFIQHGIDVSLITINRGGGGGGVKRYSKYIKEISLEKKVDRAAFRCKCSIVNHSSL